jgi:hypothetical protein
MARLLSQARQRAGNPITAFKEDHRVVTYT